MLRRFRTWLKVVLPADFTLLGVLVVVIGLIAFAVVRAKLRGEQEWHDAAGLPTLVVLISSVLYGAFRAFYFNPIENRPYGDWLAASPWKFPLPLPLGPLHLVWQDLFIVSVLMAIFPSQLLSRLVVPTSFLLAYCILMAYSQLRVGIYWSCYVVASVGGCFILAIVNPWARLVIAAGMVPAVYLGSQHILREFPPAQKDWEWLRLVPKDGDTLMTAGWPLAPKRQERWSRSNTHASAFMVSSMVAWLFFCMAFHFRELPEFEDGLLRGLTLIAGVAVIARLLLYVVGHVPPISFLGRVATGRLIIPGYDIVFLAPIVVVLVAGLLVDIAIRLDLPMLIASPAIAGIAAWLTLVLPPRHEAWQYTGHHRVAYRFRTTFFDPNKSSKRRA